MKPSSLLVILSSAALLAGCDFGRGTNSASDEVAQANSQRDGGEPENEQAEEQEEARMRRFVNSRDYAINDRLRERYIDFSFEYPSSWRSVPQGAASRESNFAQIRAPQRRGSDTINIAFGTAGFNNLDRATEADIEQLMERLGNDMGREWRNYRLVSHGRQRLGRHDTWGWRFTTEFPAGDGEFVRTHGRADIYLPEGQSHGLYVVTIVTEAAENQPDAEDIGETGDLRRLFDSLSFEREGRGERGGRREEEARRSGEDDSDLEPR